MDHSLQNLNDLTRFLASLFKTECEFEIYTGHASFTTHDGEHDSYLSIDVSPIYEKGELTNKYNIGHPEYDLTKYFMVADLDNDDKAKIESTFKDYIERYVVDKALEHNRKYHAYKKIIDFTE